MTNEILVRWNIYIWWEKRWIYEG